MRYETVLGQHKGKHWPYKVACVACAADDSELDASSACLKPKLLSWAAVELRREGDRYNYHANWEGTVVREWWDRLTAWATGSKSVVLLSQSTTRLWAVLGLWHMMESGAIEVYPADFDALDPLQWAAQRIEKSEGGKQRPHSIGDLRREIDRSCGFLVLSDPPLIARFKLVAANCWVNWYDGANYGIPRVDGQANAKECAESIATSFKRYGEYCNEFRFGKLCATAGSQSVYGWRYGHYWPGCAVDGDSRALSRESAAYYSGRAECYQLGRVGTPLFYADVRAAYCFHCRRNQVPVRLVRTVEHGDSPSWSGDGPADCAIARVSIATPVNYYPLRQDGIAIWPIGQFDTTLAGPELALALKLGHVKRVYEYSEYACEPALASVAQALFDWRCAAKNRLHDDMEAVAKLMYVSLVGQMAKRQWVWVKDDDPDCDMLYGEWTGRNSEGQQCRYRAIAGVVEREASQGYAPDTLPAIAAFIASAARVRLLELIEQAGWDHVYYADTDAIMVDDAGRQRLFKDGILSGDTLGAIGIRWGPCDVTLRGIKWYTVDGRLVCAGIPDADGLGVDSEGHYWRTETPKESVRRRHRPDAAMRLTGYVRDSVYRHGTVLRDGRIVPFILG